MRRATANKKLLLQLSEEVERLRPVDDRRAEWERLFAPFPFEARVAMYEAMKAAREAKDPPPADGLPAWAHRMPPNLAARTLRAFAEGGWREDPQEFQELADWLAANLGRVAERQNWWSRPGPNSPPKSDPDPSVDLGRWKLIEDERTPSGIVVPGLLRAMAKGPDSPQAGRAAEVVRGLRRIVENYRARECQARPAPPPAAADPEPAPDAEPDAEYF